MCPRPATLEAAHGTGNWVNRAFAASPYNQLALPPSPSHPSPSQPNPTPRASPVPPPAHGFGPKYQNTQIQGKEDDAAFLGPEVKYNAACACGATRSRTALRGCSRGTDRKRCHRACIRLSGAGNASDACVLRKVSRLPVHVTAWPAALTVPRAGARGGESVSVVMGCAGRSHDGRNRPCESGLERASERRRRLDSTSCCELDLHPFAF